MTFRDDHFAAAARAQALQRELDAARSREAERDEELERLRRQLAEARGELEAAAEREAASALDLRARAAEEAGAVERDAVAAERLGVTAMERARARLDALVEAGESRQRRAARSRRVRRAPRDDEDRGAQRRARRSVAWVGGYRDALGLWAALPFLIAAFAAPLADHHGMTATLARALAPAAGTIVALLAALEVFARLRLAHVERWSRSRPYALRGYPAVLGVRPRRRDVSDVGTPDGHVSLRLELDFEGTPPAHLDNVLRAFDAELRRDGPTSWARESPVTTRRSKHGTRLDHADTNWAVHRWVVRLDRSVLSDLRFVTPLAAATIVLTKQRPRFDR